MNAESCFALANISAALCWLPLVVAPRHPRTLAWAGSPVGPLVFAVVYVILLVVTLAGEGAGGMGSLAELRAGFAQDTELLLAWVHYLSFDMVVGFWVLRDSVRLGLSRWLVLPCLVFTFVLGPVGLVLYMALRWGLRGVLAFDAPEASEPA